MLSRKVLPFMLELYLGGLQVHLPSLQAIRLLLKVVHAATGAQVWCRDLGHLIGGNLTIDGVAHVRQGVAVNVIGVILWAIP